MYWLGCDRRKDHGPFIGRVVIAVRITVTGWFSSRGDRDGILLGRLAKRDMVMEIGDGDL